MLAFYGAFIAIYARFMPLHNIAFFLFASRPSLSPDSHRIIMTQKAFLFMISEWLRNGFKNGNSSLEN